MINERADRTLLTSSNNIVGKIDEIANSYMKTSGDGTL